MDSLHFGCEYKEITFVCQGAFSEVPIGDNRATIA